MLKLEFREDITAAAELWPGGQAPQLLQVDPAKFQALYDAGLARTNQTSLRQLKRRLTPTTFSAVQQALALLLRYGDRLFPSFRAIYGELLNEEWLSLVDYHKPFHRDHIIHQTQEALVVKRLLGELLLSCANHHLARECRDANWTRLGAYCGSVSLRQLTAYLLARGDDDTRYLYDYATDLGVDRSLLTPGTSACYWFWYLVVYNAAVTAALYHDIGYPIQFLYTVVSSAVAALPT
jgi:hypothetical protein